MKVLFLATLISLLSISGNAQKKISDREFDGLKGRVKSVFSSFTYFENVAGKISEKQSGVKFEKYYDENGNITQTLNYVVGDKNIYTLIEGNITFKTIKIDGVGGSGISSNSTSTNKQNSRNERYSIKFGYKYDKKDRITEETLYSNDNSLISKTVYKYDEQGRIKETERYNSEKISSRQTLKFDDKGNVIEEMLVFLNIKGEDGITKKYYSDYKFDAQGNWTERTETANYKRSGKISVVKTIDHRKINYFEN